MTVEEFFDEFLIDNVNLVKLCEGECTGAKSGCDICLVTSRYKDLVAELTKKLTILPTKDEENQPSYFLTGSYRRHTMIRPPKDVDLFIVLDSGEYQDTELDDLITSRALLGRLKSTLKEIFKDDSKIKIVRQRHSVLVKYDKNFSIDVIPAFETDDKKAYKIPDIEHGDDGSYIVSNPKTHYEYINGINDSTSVGGKKRFKKVVRLLKFIKRKEFKAKPIKIRSFHFELLAAKIIGSNKINSYSEGLVNFLLKASNYFDKACIIDPANPDNKVDDYIDDLDLETRKLIKTKLNDLYVICQRAIEIEISGKDVDAIEEWKKIFDVQTDDYNKGGFSSGPAYIGRSPARPWSNI